MSNPYANQGPMVPMSQYPPQGSPHGHQPGPPQHMNPFNMQPANPRPQPFHHVPLAYHPGPHAATSPARAPVAGGDHPIDVAVPRSDNEIFGALARGFPDRPWKCRACTYRNLADRMFCAMCELERTPLHVQQYNHHMRNEAFFIARSFQPHKGENTYLPSPPPAGRTIDPNAPVDAPAETKKESGGDKGEDDLDKFTQVHEDQMKVLCLSQDQFNQLLATGLAAFQVFKTVMATLLSIFVPQLCPGEKDDPRPSYQIDHDCTIEENFQELDDFNIFVTTWNFITLFVALIHYFMVYRREVKMNELLDEDPTVTNDNLVARSQPTDPCVLDMYPTIAAEIRRHNVRVMIVGGIVIFFYIINVLVSAVLIFGYWYAGFRSITTFVTNMALTFNVITSQWNWARKGIQTGVVYSMYKSDPAVFTNIDRALVGREPYFVKPTKMSTDAR